MVMDAMNGTKQCIIADMNVLQSEFSVYRNPLVHFINLSKHKD